MFFKNMFKRKVNLFLIEPGSVKEIKTNICYDKKTKGWFMKVFNDSIPVSENIFKNIKNDRLFLIREGLDTYIPLSETDLYGFVKGEKNVLKELNENRITAKDIILAREKAELRLLRSRSILEQYMPIVFFVVSAIALGVFVSIVVSNMNTALKELSALTVNLTQTQAEVMKIQNDIITKQLELFGKGVL